MSEKEPGTEPGEQSFDRESQEAVLKFAAEAGLNTRRIIDGLEDTAQEEAGEENTLREVAKQGAELALIAMQQIKSTKQEVDVPLPYYRSEKSRKDSVQIMKEILQAKESERRPPFDLEKKFKDSVMETPFGAYIIHYETTREEGREEFQRSATFLRALR